MKPRSKNLRRSCRRHPVHRYRGLWEINCFDGTAGLNGGTGTSYVTITAVPEPPRRTARRALVCFCAAVPAVAAPPQTC